MNLAKRSSFGRRRTIVRLTLVSSFAAASFALGATPAPSPLRSMLIFTFDDSAPIDASHPRPRFLTQFKSPDFVPGINGRAWRSDGFSSSVDGDLRIRADKGFTVQAWVALESYPSALELPVERQVPGSLMQQATSNRGFDLFMDTYGRWGFRVETTAGTKEIKASDLFPLYAWSLVTATYDPDSGVQRLYLDDKLVAESKPGKPAQFLPADVPFQIAKSWRNAPMLVFNINGINAAYDNVRVYEGTLDEKEIVRQFKAVTPPSALESLAVPPSRFANDLQRPTYHAMPPANWTNEPYGLIHRDGVWHMFYQRTPNGPFKTQMVWGHMASPDLVNWTNLQDALWPSLQNDSFGFDMKGIWSGNVVSGDDGKVYAFYTSVNHSPDIFNPGISVAVSDDKYLRIWKKLGPVLDRTGLRDFRDPFVWKQDGEWRMLVGAALVGRGGGLAYYRCATNLADLKCWKKQPAIAPFAAMDVGSEIWEMPVFEEIGGGKYLLIANPIGNSVSKYGDPATRALYWIGSWDGAKFVPDSTKPKFLDILPGHLSPTVARTDDGRLVGIGIVDERRTMKAQLAAGWAHTFSLPRVYRLLDDAETLTLGQSPWPGLAQLRTSAQAHGHDISWSGDKKVADFGRSYEFEVDYSSMPENGHYGVYIAASPDRSEITRIYYDAVKKQIVLDKSKSSTGKGSDGPTVLGGDYDEKAFGVPTKFHLFVDHSVVDVFINDAAAFSFRVYPARSDSQLFGMMSNGPAKADISAWVLNPPSKN